MQKAVCLFAMSFVIAATAVPTRLTKSVTKSANVDYYDLKTPEVGDTALHVLSPTLLQVVLINTKGATSNTVNEWNLVDTTSQFQAPLPSSFTVTADGQGIPVAGVGFKRRPAYAPLAVYDMRIENSLYLQLAQPLADGQEITVANSDGKLAMTTAGSSGLKSLQLSQTVDPLRYSPAVHVNQEGYLPRQEKKAMVGYYAGSLGEMAIPTNGGFTIVDARTGKKLFTGKLVQRKDVGYQYTPTPYQQVYEADFTAFKRPGEYRLMVPGLGGSMPFIINDGIVMGFARAYALGLYHQRCGTNIGMPYSRFQHDRCHFNPASVPWPAANYAFTWTTISNYGLQINPDNPVQTAPPISAGTMLFPFVRQGSVETLGGHHDAGDYSKYTISSASFIHYLMFEVDSLNGVAALDNLGIPESGDGISDVLQEAKWEADYLAKIQDTDGGFYFLTYPVNREYEASLPEQGDPQVVWPKTTVVTAAAVAAMAQCASSPAMKRAYPAAAATYAQKAQLGWQFLMNAISKYGKNGAYQKITHYGDNFADNDEMAWAACQMYLLTGDSSIHQMLLSWFDPSNPATWHWGWTHMSECYGHAIRSYAFAVQSKRITEDKLDPTFLKKCQTEIVAAGDDVLKWSQQSAYGTSFPSATKAVQSAGWYFSTDQCFDMAVAYQLNKKPDYIRATLANMNYEGGCNPVNVCYMTGLGLKRQVNVVSQWALYAKRVLPPSGLPQGNIQAAFFYLWNYQAELEKLCFPSDGGVPPYPFYDRWADAWNVSTEFVTLNSARSLGALTFLANVTQTTPKPKPWKSIPTKLKLPASGTVGVPVTAMLLTPRVNVNGARFVWEAKDQQPFYGDKFTFTPKGSGDQWVEMEAELPDGRRVFGTGSFPVK